MDHHFQQVCELRDKFGTYRSAGLVAKTSRGTTPNFQTPHIKRSLRHEAKEDLHIVRLCQHVTNYNKKMEQTKIESLGFKLLCERNEA